MSVDAPEHQEAEVGLAELRSLYRQRGIELGDRIEALAPRLRFVRLNPRFDRRETVRRLRIECVEHVQGLDGSVPGDAGGVPSYPLLVPWLAEEWGFYALPGDFPLSRSPCFRSGRLYGHDVSSGAAVAVLLTDAYDRELCASSETVPSSDPLRVLDLCCAPGLKLCALADWLKANSVASELMGVDISQRRVDVCKRVIHKYHIDLETSGESRNDSSTDTRNAKGSGSSDVHIQIYCHDGTTFLRNNIQSMDLVFDSYLAQEQTSNKRRRKRMNKSARARQAKELKRIQQRTATLTKEDGVLLFDRVLLDVECSTDGSIKHMLERLQNNTFAGSRQQPLVTDGEELGTLVALQKRLAANAFRLLKPGGTMVYSTCSMDERQNEGVVRWLLQSSEDAKLVPLTFSELSIKEVIVDGSLSGTLRFIPLAFGVEVNHAGASASGKASLSGGGFFLAKVMKIPQAVVS